MPWAIWSTSCAAGTERCTPAAPTTCPAASRPTRSRLPVELVYQEEAADRSAALRREAAIKRLDRGAKLALIAGGPPGPPGGARAEK